jgi:hypothetical protein
MVLSNSLDEKAPLWYGRQMDLATHLKNNDLTEDAFAAKIPVRPFTVRRWCRGDRLPGKKYMPRIVEVTDGQVTANDFYARAQERDKA